ncbi:hypothetical protein AVEN_100918-1 [Araneus ventricosus]|uniref:Uncharacterized protein n=1 Tax=Araneus ventricosus TaxID=182803 RepID=A0A4Y2AWG1_ARAVE|nr:hypothetical protein AVEN_100918-1 [Araneus ventricosus]
MPSRSMKPYISENLHHCLPHFFTVCSTPVGTKILTRYDFYNLFHQTFPVDTSFLSSRPCLCCCKVVVVPRSQGLQQKMRSLAIHNLDFSFLCSSEVGDVCNQTPFRVFKNPRIRRRFGNPFDDLDWILVSSVEFRLRKLYRKAWFLFFN